MNNRDLLKEAIADAKTVKDTAIANAKAALEEAFNPMMRAKLAEKLAALDEEDEAKEEMTEMKEEGIEENYDLEEMDEMYEEELEEYGDEHPVPTSTAVKSIKSMQKEEELDLEELLRELDEDESELKEYAETSPEEMLASICRDYPEHMACKNLKEDLHEEESLLNDPKGPTAHGNVAEAEDDEDGEIDLENMDEDDLKSFIESVIADMVEAGELEAGEAGEAEEAEEDEDKEDEEEVKGEMMAEVKKMKKEVEEAKKAKLKAEKELKEAFDTLKTIKTELNEVNLFNAKLLYANKIFKAKNLTESQKVKVLAAFDKAASVKEAKLVFETLSEGFTSKKAPVNESLLRGSASKPAGIVEKKPILEVNNQFARWQQLAGINKNKNNN